MPIDSDRKVRTAGLGFIIGLCLLVATTFLVDDDGNVFTSPYNKRYTVFLDDTKLIQEGSIVKQYGTKVGFVETTRVVEIDDSYQAEVTMIIKDDTILHGDANAELESTGILQGPQIALIGGTPDSPEMPQGGTIPTKWQPSILSTFEELDKTITGMPDGGLGRMFLGNAGLKKTDAILGGLASDGGMGKWILGSSAQSQFAPITEDIKVAMTNVRKGTENTGVIARLLNDSALGKAAEQLVADLRAGMTGLRKGLADVAAGKGVLGRLAKSESLGEMAAEIIDGFQFAGRGLRGGKSPLSLLISDKKMGDEFGNGVTGVTALADGLANGEGLVPQLVKDPTLYDEVVKIAQQLRESVEDVRESYTINLMSDLVESNAASLLPIE